jgi:poly-gamma-glutamate capsule biosynthesis protein CapA/YwtB (metallophosphatase superfamily)
MLNMRNALKALGAALAVIALCAPLMLLPVDDTQPAVAGYAGVTITVPPTVHVATTIPGLTSTTTTTEPPAPPPTTEPAPSTTTTTTEGPIDITIAATGDVLTPTAVLDSVRDPQTGSYDFGPVLAPIAPYLAKADYTVAALGPRLAGPKAGYGDSPTANAPNELAFALRAAGIDMVATANSHSLDLGWEGVVGTLDRLDAAGLAHVGTSRTSQERNTPVIVDIRGIAVAFLDYTASVARSLPEEDKKDFAVNMLDPATVTRDAMTARSWGADAVVALISYGTEDLQAPSADQVALSEEILNHGVDAILGCEAGVVQPIGHVFTYASWRTNDKYVAYSLGDLLSAAKEESSGSTSSTSTTLATHVASVANSGLIAYLHLEQRGLRTYVTGVSYLPVYVQMSAGTGKEPATYRVLPVLPGLEPRTDVPLTVEDRQRMAQLWERLRTTVFRPDEKISPLVPSKLGL